MNLREYLDTVDAADVEELEQLAQRKYDEWQAECARPKLTTLDWLSTRLTGYAFNELTGDIASVDGNGTAKVLSFGTSPAGMCSLLFDPDTVARSWAPMSDKEALDRLYRRGSN